MIPLLRRERLWSPAGRHVMARLHPLRSFSVLENKLAYIDIIGENDDDDDVDRNGLHLPPVGSIIAYSSQRQYRLGVYCGKKMIDGIQKLQVRNEHDCIRDVCLYCRP